MLKARQSRVRTLAIGATLALCLSGCTSLREYIENGFKVGPNYCEPPAPVAEHWIDAADQRVRSQSEDLSRWWTVFQDPVLRSEDSVLNRLVLTAYRQNLSLGQAGFRILEARAQLGIAQGELFPQLQDATGAYRRQGTSLSAPSGFFSPKRYFSQWNYGFNLAWELDFWGRFRRAVAAADAQLDASVEGYDDVLVTLLADVAANYVQVRTLQERIKLLEENVELQKGVLTFVETRFKAGFRVNELDVDQAKSTLAQTQAAIPQLESDLRQANNRLCVLLGIPPEDLRKTIDLWRAIDAGKTEEVRKKLGIAYIPTVPVEVAVGIPAELLRRRPDLRRAERLAASQCQQIGIAEAELYPAISFSGTFGFQARDFKDLFNSRAFNGSVGPSFQWNLLNYGRIANNVRLQDARFEELVLAYQGTVLQAQAEVEDGVVAFLRAQERAKLLDESVAAAEKAVKIVVAQLDKGAVDFNRYALIEQNLVQQQDLRAQARGQIALGLIQVYRALGGGWQIRLESDEDVPARPATPPAAPATPPVVPARPLGATKVPDEAPRAPLPEAPEVLEDLGFPPPPGPMPLDPEAA